MSWFTDLETAIITGAKTVGADIVTEARAVWNKIAPDVAIEAEELATIALNIVEADLIPILTGTMTIGQAVNSVVAAVEKSGKSALLTDAETAVTFAKQQLQVNVAPPVAAPVAQ